MGTTIRNGNLFCINCGGEHKLIFPMPVDEMSKHIKSFDKLHKKCKKTWTEPEADQSQSVQKKAMFWMANGERGQSSETMWNCLMNNDIFPINHPYDGDDFSRCYKLLQFVPEWRNELHKLKPLSKQWSNLVDNWDKLTEMYEENKRTNWQNTKEVGMYEFMSELIK